MSAKQIDARGLSCPQPVVLTQKAISEGGESFDVLVNSNVSKENVVRCVEKNRMKAEIRQDGEDYIISVSR
ncbi:MAG TPA: sulfurtransferase TusA family protein [Spirochaetota bacterium]|nr:sulfurtransferase TusA family protein [Spirochaetota bacterium]HSA14523.1 sulfurtransferase TusA family protein [Spirochaetota bacterium]